MRLQILLSIIVINNRHAKVLEGVSKIQEVQGDFYKKLYILKNKLRQALEHKLSSIANIILKIDNLNSEHISTYFSNPY